MIGAGTCAGSVGAHGSAPRHPAANEQPLHLRRRHARAAEGRAHDAGAGRRTRSRRADRVVNARVPALPTGASWACPPLHHARRKGALRRPSSRRSAGLGAGRAALIPLKKSAQWWDLAQDERRQICEDVSRHTSIGLRYLSPIARTPPPIPVISADLRFHHLVRLRAGARVRLRCTARRAPREQGMELSGRSTSGHRQATTFPATAIGPIGGSRGRSAPPVSEAAPPGDIGNISHVPRELRHSDRRSVSLIWRPLSPSGLPSFDAHKNGAMAGSNLALALTPGRALTSSRTLTLEARQHEGRTRD